ncbi:DBH-like monooxygenase protein 1 homolog [Branchiostoma floridae]|uniref:DBH-like monooxygenase protein 1 homolog n=1 Tax=Branchiostoma floridae TaxID=7739 RepID=A0A9J7KBS1_BRAFL|nr:DBH-like monooxygenase protein 1 homolog [Branchiostoma floridae]
MPGSDIVIGWVKDGQAYLTDRYAEDKALPPVDESQDWELLSGYENETHTVLRFKRKLQTCDVRDRVINKDTLRVLWAWNEHDPDGDTGPGYHGHHRGVRSSVLLRNDMESDSLPAQVHTYDVTMANATIPAKRTTYWCKLLEGPTLQTKHHIFKVAVNLCCISVINRTVSIPSFIPKTGNGDVTSLLSKKKGRILIMLI